MRSIIIDFYIEKDIQWCQLIFSLMEIIIIRDNRETCAASKCSLTSIHYHYQQRLLVLEKRFMFQMLAFLILWRFELCEPRQLLMLLLSLVQSFFLLSNPLTEHCTHCVCVCARTTANYKPNEMITMYSMRHFCNTSFKFLIVLIAPELKRASIFNAILAR